MRRFLLLNRHNAISPIQRNGLLPFCSEKPFWHPPLLQKNLLSPRQNVVRVQYLENRPVNAFKEVRKESILYLDATRLNAIGKFPDILAQRLTPPGVNRIWQKNRPVDSTHRAPP
jgi:hypothetical protein